VVAWCVVGSTDLQLAAGAAGQRALFDGRGDGRRGLDQRRTQRLAARWPLRRPHPGVSKARGTPAAGVRAARSRMHPACIPYASRMHLALLA
jgi:hypothetical protein